jgi:hypothetical protein
MTVASEKLQANLAEVAFQAFREKVFWRHL